MIKENINIINEKIKNAALKSGRKAEDIRLVAVSKRFPVETIEEAYNNGLKTFGENRIQEAVEKADYFLKKDLKDIEFHIIGNIQLNKVKYLKDKFKLIHSVDRIELVKQLDKRLPNKQNILIQVNLEKETQKSGVFVEDLDELIDFVLKSDKCRLQGLMLIPPDYGIENKLRDVFFRMNNLFEKCKNKFGVDYFKYLSMGMSGDFEIAIEEGANMVRIGSAIFGPRKY
jgi:pyridoxal phosphate enzyme (YggS family)